MKPETIGFVTTSFPRFDGDFAGNFVFHMTKGFAAIGYNIEVIVPEPPTGTPRWWQELSENFPWLTIHPVAYAPFKSWQQIFFKNGAPDNLAQNPLTWSLVPSAIFQLRRSIANHAPRWCATVSHWLLPSTLVAQRIPGINHPHLAIAHSGDVHLLGKLPGKSVISALIAKRTTTISFVSKQLQNEFQSYLPTPDYPAKLTCTPMGIPQLPSLPSHREARQHLGLNEFTLLFVGRLVSIKGIDTLIDAAALGNFRLIIAGEGQQRHRLEQLCLQKNVRATFTGHVGPQQRTGLLRAADILVVPSKKLDNGRHEGVPMIIAEAMQARIPVIATRTGGISEIIEHRVNGILIEPNQPVALKNAIDLLENHPILMQTIIEAANITAKMREWHFLIPKYHKLLFN